MSVAVVMPQLGLTMEEGTVSAWLKKTGDPVKKDELLFSVSTDKVEMDVESAAEGVLGEIIQEAGSTVPVGTVLAYIKVASEAGAQPNSQNPEAGKAEENSTLPAMKMAVATQAASRPGGNGNAAAKPPGGAQPAASPRAKRLAKELGIDLSQVRASNPDGPITEEDIRAARHQPAAAPSVGSRRQLIAERLTRSVQTIPTFSVCAELNAERLVALHESLRASLSEAAAVKLTITDLLLSAMALALKDTPEVNATWEENSLRNRTSVDIGLAVATAKGLMAPVIRNVEALDLGTLAARRSELVEKARTARLSLVDLEGGVGTLSNLGMYRVDQFQAIITPGQAFILAAGQIRQRPWVEKTLTAKPTLLLNLTVDHRVADGAAAAVFLGKMIRLLEDPSQLSETCNAIARHGAEGGSNGQLR